MEWDDGLDDLDDDDEAADSTDPKGSAESGGLSDDDRALLEAAKKKGLTAKGILEGGKPADAAPARPSSRPATEDPNRPLTAADAESLVAEAAAAAERKANASLFAKELRNRLRQIATGPEGYDGPVTDTRMRFLEQEVARRIDQDERFANIGADPWAMADAVFAEAEKVTKAVISDDLEPVKRRKGTAEVKALEGIMKGQSGSTGGGEPKGITTGTAGDEDLGNKIDRWDFRTGQYSEDDVEKAYQRDRAKLQQRLAKR